MNILNDSLVNIARAILEGASYKLGQMLSASSIEPENLVFKIHKLDHKNSYFDEYLDPTEGGGGGSGITFIENQLTKFGQQHKIKTSIFKDYTLDYFIPKSKVLFDIAKRVSILSPFSSSYAKTDILDEAKDVYKYIGAVRTTESYRLIIDETTYKSLPEDIIGNTSYDYSFHGGEGIIASFIMAIGKSESDVKSKLKKALGKVKAEYIGNAMELKYAQKRAVGR